MPGGRPRKKIEVEQLKKLAERGWSARQIASHFEVDEATVRRRFSAIIAEARQHGQAKLLDILWQRGVAEKSDRILKDLADRIIGPVPKKIEITREQALEFLEKELERDGTDSSGSTEGKETK